MPMRVLQVELLSDGPTKHTPSETTERARGWGGVLRRAQALSGVSPQHCVKGDVGSVGQMPAT